MKQEHVCIVCGERADRRFYLDPHSRRSTGEWVCEAHMQDAITASVTDVGLRFEIGLRWLRAEARRQKKGGSR